MNDHDAPSKQTPDVIKVSDVPKRAEELAGTNTLLTDTNADASSIVSVSKGVLIFGAQLAIGDKIGKYEIRALLGEGGMGVVYLAYDPLIEREVALKVLSQDVGSNPTALQRFLGEARAIGRLNSPHVVSVYDIDLWKGQYYLVMELLTGGSVADYTEKRGSLPWNEAFQIVAQAARGLAAAHAAGTIHRDIKPENLMLSADGVVKVVDFGLSKLLDSAETPKTAVTKAGQILGTPQYMSPEQFEAEDVDARTDVYSLGATLFRLLTARFPYHDCRTVLQVMTAHLSKPPPNPLEFVSDLPADCARIISRAMAKNPAERYQTAEELAADLQETLERSQRGADSVSLDSVEPDRPLASAVIVEPSKFQGLVLKDLIGKTGATRVELVATVADAKKTIERDAPDLLISAMQLPDGQGIDLLQQLSGKACLARSCVVLNSNDSTMAELASAASAASLLLASKKVRPEDMLRVVHACGPCVVSSGPLTAAIEPLAVRLRIVLLDDERIPDLLADLIRSLGILDVEVLTGGAWSSDTESVPPLTLVLRTLSKAANDSAQQAADLAAQGNYASLLAVVQSAPGGLLLRSVSRQGVQAVCRRPLDAARLVCLIQAGRT